MDNIAKTRVLDVSHKYSRYITLDVRSIMASAVGGDNVGLLIWRPIHREIYNQLDEDR